MTKTFKHPNPTLFRLTQYLVFVALLVLLLTVPLQVMIAVIYPQAVLFYLSALITLFFALPLSMHLVTTPTVSVASDGITIHPFIGKAHHLAWGDIERVAYYPLLPRQNHEVNKRLIVGRKNYKPAEGVMLISSKLPQVYRITGLFVGEPGRKLFALTNRTHAQYDQLYQYVINATHTTL
jgi:hypothetical protein